MLLAAVIGVVALALLFDFTNGFHDAANSVATVVATRAMKAKYAVWFSGAFNFLAYFLVGTAVANTVAKIVDAGHSGVAVVFSALIGAIAWNYITWYIGMPSSSSHAIIGGLVGAGIASGGLHVINWKSVDKTALAIFISPLVAFSIAFVAMYLVFGIQKLTKWNDEAKPFKGLQLLSAGAVSFGHGANDAQKTMGVVAALLAGTGYLHVAPGSKTIPIPEWVALGAYSAIALGTIWGGWKIIETVGLRITTLHANSGLAANIGATTSIFGATAMGIPISTTHAAATSVMGAGVGSGKGINLKVVGKMLLAWIVTLPASAAVAWCLFHLTQLPTAFAWITVGAVLIGLGAWIVFAMTHTIGASDIEAELPTEDDMREGTTARPTLSGSGPLA
jgi:inorganic phosphate transporter, PiT family